MAWPEDEQKRETRMWFPNIDGFLPGRASFMLDVVFLVMFVFIPILAWSIFLVRYRKRYALHKRLQLVLGIVLLAAVTLFEVDIRVNGWEQRAVASPYYPPSASAPWVRSMFVDLLGREQPPGPVHLALGIHLVFAVSTGPLWIYVIAAALRNFPNPPTPNAYSPRHIFWARLAALDLLLTAITGWIFYWLAFVA